MIRGLLKWLSMKDAVNYLEREKTALIALIALKESTLAELDERCRQVECNLVEQQDRFNLLKTSDEQIRELRRKAIADARKFSLSLSMPLVMKKLNNAHRIAREIIDEANATADRIMGGAESYAETMRSLTEDEKVELMKEAE